MPNRRRTPKAPVPPLRNLAVARELCGRRPLTPADRIRPESMEAAAAHLNMTKQNLARVEAGGDADMLASDLRRASCIFGLSGDFLLGLPGAERLHPSYRSHLDELVRDMRNRPLGPDSALQAAITFLHDRDGELFPMHLFQRRLGLDPSEFEDLMQGQIPDGYTAKRMQELLRIPAVWFQTGDSDDLPGVILSDADLLRLTLDEWGVTWSEFLSARDVIIAYAKGRREAGR